MVTTIIILGVFLLIFSIYLINNYRTIRKLKEDKKIALRELSLSKSKNAEWITQEKKYKDSIDKLDARIVELFEENKKLKEQPKKGKKNK